MKKTIIALILVLIMSFSVISVNAASITIPSNTESSMAETYDLNHIDQDKIDKMVNNVLKQSKVPGLSIAIISNEQTKYLSYGYSDVKNNININDNTLFEIGSMTKAFTALGFLLLEDQGKLKLDDKVSDYIPGFYVYYKGYHEGRKFDGNIDLTINQVLYQTSGIPSKTLGNISEGDSDRMLEETVKSLFGVKLDFFPGERFQYATINYDILGYIIELVSGQKYEDFIKENILIPIGLDETYLFRNEAESTGFMAKGYKINFFQANEYKAPIYRGNTPAGYIISSASQMERWMRIQLGLIEVSDQFKRIIEKSHLGDMSVASQGDYYYASGWHVRINNKSIWHNGANPNYSSVIIMQPDEKFGICVLSNMDSNAASFLGDNILNIKQERKEIVYSRDNYNTLDITFSWVIILSFIIFFVYLFLLIKTIIELILKKRETKKIDNNKIVGFLFGFVVIIIMGFCLYYLPNIIMDRLPWSAVNVWGASTIRLGCILGYVASIVFLTYVILTFNFPKEKEKGYFGLIPLNLVNGIISALTIFIVNETFNRNLEFSNELFVYFIFALIFFIYTMKLLQTKMIFITNENSYEKRILMIDKVISSSFQSIEKIGRDRIFSGLNNDTAAIAQIPTVIIGFITNLVTIIFCLSFIYLKNSLTFFVSVAIILLNSLIAFFTSKVAAAYWEKNRDIQDTHFGLMTDFVNGFKELSLNTSRKYAFWLDLKKYTRMTSELNKSAAIKFLNFDLYKSMMFNMIFGVVVFVFPLLIVDINVNILRENLFIIFYVIGPFTAIANIIPQFTQLNIHMKRINKLINDLDSVSTGNKCIKSDIKYDYPNYIKINLNNVVYKYLNDENDETSEFTLGPISTEIKSGELTFITGGNGSGKSTLGKIITGLYNPTEGDITLNGERTDICKFNELFSSVYSDYNLFKKLYGIDFNMKKDEINQYLKMMNITDKVEINADGEFKSIDLSTGQKKRLAFLIACLEDKPMMILDEWAAEQDPEFRHYFYNDLLYMLKDKGKGVVVITHDDRYFDMADKIIKLERGVLVNELITK